MDITAYFGLTATGHFKIKVIVPLTNQYIHPSHNLTTISYDIGVIS